MFTHPENKSGFFYYFFFCFSNFCLDFFSLQYIIRTSDNFLFFSFLLPLLNDLSSEYVSPAKIQYISNIRKCVFILFFILFYFGFLADEKNRKQHSIIYEFITILIYALIRLIAKQIGDNMISYIIYLYIYKNSFENHYFFSIHWILFNQRFANFTMRKEIKIKIKELEYYFILRFYTHKREKLWQHTKRWQQHPLSSVPLFFISFVCFQLGSTAFLPYTQNILFFSFFLLYTHKHSH